MKQPCHVVIVVFVVLLTSLGTVAPQKATADVSQICSTTDSRLRTDFGTDIPVVLIHGVQGSPAAWESSGNSTICSDIDKLDGIAVTLNFGYTGIDWGLIAKQLVPLIDRLADQSVSNGGHGKVVLVGYSLGTVIIRNALANSSLNGKVGQVITVAAPNSSFNPSLSYPSNVVVRAIAGDITKAVVRGKKHLYQYTHSDGLIGVDDALKRYTNNPEVGGGRLTINCTETFQGTTFGKHLSPFNDKCEHGNLLKNPQVGDGVVIGIKTYVESLSGDMNVDPINVSVQGLHLSFPSDTWTVYDGVGGPNEHLVAQDWSNTASCTNCSSPPPPLVPASLDVLHIDSGCTDTMQVCAIGQYQVIEPVPSLTVGGRIADYSTRYQDDQYQGTYLVWCFSAERICLYYRRAVDTPKLELSDAARDVLASANWSG